MAIDKALKPLTREPCLSILLNPVFQRASGILPASTHLCIELRDYVSSELGYKLLLDLLKLLWYIRDMPFTDMFASSDSPSTKIGAVIEMKVRENTRQDRECIGTCLLLIESKVLLFQCISLAKGLRNIS